MAAKGDDMMKNNDKQLKRQTRAEGLMKIENLAALITAVDAGAFAEVASTIGSVATTDFRSENDEKTTESKALISAARVMAEWFQLTHDKVANGSYPADSPFEEAAWQHVDESRSHVFEKFWFLHDEITQRIFPTDSKADKRGRKAAGNNVQAILDQYFTGRMTCRSKFTIGDPDYNEPPPTRQDFISATPPRKSSVTKLIAKATGFITTALSPRQAKAAAKTKLQTAPPKKTLIGSGAIPKGAASQNVKKTAPP